MADILVTSPFKPFTLPTQFKAVFNGYIYCGTVDAVDPSVSQVQVYLVNESGDRVPVAQPLRTNAGGFLVYNGQPAKFVTDTNHSILVKDSMQVQLWYQGDMSNVDPDSLFAQMRSYFPLAFASVGDMVAGNTIGGISVTLKVGDECSTGATKWRVGTNTAGVSLGAGLYADPLTSICIDDYAFSSSVDCSVALQAILVMASAFGIGRVYSKGGKTYKLDNTIDFRGLKAIDLDFGWSVLIDNVQGFLPPAVGSRAKQTFILYHCNGSKVRCINWMVSPTRATKADPNIPDILIWLGGQNEGSEITTNVHAHEIVFQQTKIGMMPIGVLGELRGCSVKNIDIYGDASYGINFEYGLQPSDPAINPGLDNGLHPYNCKIENFNGYDLHNCQGFLRVASCYNVKFKNCQGFNVKSFIYCYGGDRNISRFSENIRFVNCKSKIVEATLPAVNYAVTIAIVNKDGSTGDPLPAFTNYTHFFVFDNCEFQNSTGIGSSCVRFFGNQGKAVFNNCLLKGSYYGLFAEPSSNPSYRSRSALDFNSCVFMNNYQDVRMNAIDGASFDKCSFKQQNNNSTLPQVSLSAVDTCNFTTFTDCLWSEQPKQALAIDNGASVGTKLRGNRFDLNSVAHTAIQSTTVLHGDGTNTTNGTLISTANTAKRIRGEPSTGFKDTSGLTGPTIDYEVADKWLVTSTLTTSNCINVKDGDELIFRGGTGGASLTINHAVGGTGRYLNKSGVNDTVTGNTFAKKYVYSGGVWYEM